MRTVLFRCFLACVLLATFVAGTVTVCGVLASSRPGFYADALAEPLEAEDVKKALVEIDEIFESLETFIALGDPDLDIEELSKAIRLASAEPAQGMTAASARRLERLANSSLDELRSDTIDVTLSQRQLNAWILTEMRSDRDDWKRPRLVLQPNKIRYAVGVDTPAGEAVLSCDFMLGKSKTGALQLELHAVRCGNLPLPAATLLKQYMSSSPKMPDGLLLNVDGDRPVLTFTELTEGKLQLDAFQVGDREVHVTLSRTSEDAGNDR